MRRNLLLGLAGLLLALLLTFHPAAAIPGAAPAGAPGGPAGAVIPAGGGESASARDLKVGLHLENVYNLSLEQQTFQVEGWYWLEWAPALQARMERESITPDQLVEFVNQVESWDALIQPDSKEPIRRPGNSFYQLFRFSAKFYVDQIDQRRSPFESIRLPVVLEVRPDSFSLERTGARLVPEQLRKGLIGEYGSLFGYALEGASLELAPHRYTTDFGLDKNRTYSRVTLWVHYRARAWAAFMKWVLPLLIVMVIVLMAPSLEGSMGDVRLAIPSTALLTLVFLQQSYRSELPPIPYLTFLDELYAYSYLVSLGAFLLFLWSSNRYAAASAEQLPLVIRRIHRVDSLCQIGAALGFVVVAVLAWHF